MKAVININSEKQIRMALEFLGHIYDENLIKKMLEYSNLPNNSGVYVRINENLPSTIFYDFMEYFIKKNNFGLKDTEIIEAELIEKAKLLAEKLK